jgi:GNAT superfamily N-acetyltransferase
MTVDVRSYRAADRDAVIDLVLAIQRGEFGVPVTLADQPDLADVEHHYARGRGGFWTATVDGRVVGVVGLLDGGGAVALRKMFVAREHRGSGLGVASRLLDALVAHARAHGVDRIHLGTRPEMHAAHRFYERNGFVRVDEAELPESFPRMKVDSVFYARALVGG